MSRIIFVFIVATILGVEIQSLLSSSVSYRPISPDLFLILVLELALDFPGIGGLLGAFSLGLIADCASGRLIGPNAAGAVVVFYFFYFISSRITARNNLSVLAFCFFGSLIKSTVYVGMLSVVANQFSFEVSLFRNILLESLLTMLVGPFVIALLRRSAGRGLGYLRMSRGDFNMGSANKSNWGM